MYVGAGLCTRRARSQFLARELPVRASMCTDRIRHRACDYVLYVNIFLVSYFPYTTLKYVILVNIINNENLNCFSSLTTGKVSRLTMS